MGHRQSIPIRRFMLHVDNLDLFRRILILESVQGRPSEPVHRVVWTWSVFYKCVRMLQTSRDSRGVRCSFVGLRFGQD